MTDEVPSMPEADCPTCHTKHSVALEDGGEATVLCQCGKLLKIQRSHGTLVVIEQIQPVLKVEPAHPPI